MNIKPIETRYKGYRFRSRIEARWAVFFDALGIKWEYEKEGYDLGDAGWYLPDFWLPEISAWIEIKGAKPSVEDLAKCKAMRMAMGNSGAVDACLVGGKVAYKIASVAIYDTMKDYSCSATNASNRLVKHLLIRPKMFLFEGVPSGMIPDKDSCLVFFLTENGDRVLTVEVSTFHMLYCGLLNKDPNAVESAANTARSARFEHGENGAK